MQAHGDRSSVSHEAASDALARGSASRVGTNGHAQGVGCFSPNPFCLAVAKPR